MQLANSALTCLTNRIFAKQNFPQQQNNSPQLSVSSNSNIIVQVLSLPSQYQEKKLGPGVGQSSAIANAELPLAYIRAPQRTALDTRLQVTIWSGLYKDNSQT